MDNQYSLLIKAILDSSGIGKADIKKIQKVLEKYKVNVSAKVDTASTIKELKKLKPEFEKILSEIAEKPIKLNTKDFKNALKQLQKDAQNAAKANTVTKSIEQEYSQNTSQESSSSKSLDDASASSDKLQTVWDNLSGWSPLTALEKGFESIKEGTKFIAELDDAMTDISYTSNMTASGLGELGDSSISMAKELNTSATNILEAVKIYSTGSSSAEDILRKSKAAIVLSNVSQMSGAQSAQTIDTSIDQFELEDTDANLMDIVDTLEYVAGQLNCDFTDAMNEISEGIEASGSASHSAGLSIQEYSSMIGLAVEKSGQSGSTIGNAYKTVLSRITEASDSEGTSDKDISKAEKALKGINVQVRDSKNEFRDFSDTMSDIGSVWDSLSSSEKSGIGLEVAGTGDLDTLNSLFGSWEDYENIIGNIDERSGLAMQNQEKYADSLNGHLGELEATGQSIWNNVLNSSELEFAVGALNGVLTVIDGLTSSIGGLVTIGLGASITMFIKNLGWLTLRATNNLA